MKTACLTILLASALSAAATPFSFLSNGDEPAEPATMPSVCVAEESAMVRCIVEIGAAETAEDCFDECEDHDVDTCEEGCALLNQCSTTCVPGCEGVVDALVDCHLAEHSVDCQCSSAGAPTVDFVGSFALKLANAMKDQRKASRSSSSGRRRRRSAGPSLSAQDGNHPRSVPRGDAKGRRKNAITLLPLCTAANTAADKCWASHGCMLGGECDVPDPDPDKTCTEENKTLNDSAACCPKCADEVEAIRSCRGCVVEEKKNIRA